MTSAPTACEHCGARVFWGETPAGDRVPLEVEPIAGAYTMDDATGQVRSVVVYRSHILLCRPTGRAA